MKYRLLYVSASLTPISYEDHKQVINLRRRYVCTRSRTDVVYFEPLDPIYSNKTDGSYTTSLSHEPMNDVFFKSQMTISVFSTNSHSIVCYHARFVFVGTLKKSGRNPRDKVLRNLQPWILSWSFAPTSPSGAFANFLWHQSVVDPITIESFENCVYKKPRWKISSHLLFITLPLHTPTSNLYHALEVALNSFPFFFKIIMGK